MKLVVALGLLLAGCTHSTHLVHVADFDPTYASFAKGEWVSAETEQFVVLGIAEDTRFVEDAFKKLADACPGHVQGVQTEYATDHGFFSWTNRVRMQGLCVR